ncbi:MAG TPA: hypothetical protein VHG70_04655, partial [Nocardioidaceae bacterium]|nr:hypothetical protein [Nocardioidaceae bacterium]
EAAEQVARQREEASADAERMLSRARREAEQVVATARRQAEQITAHGKADAERSIESMRQQLESLQRRRDGIVAQLSALRDVVAGFASYDDEDAEQPQRSEPAAQSVPEQDADSTQVMGAVTDSGRRR